VPEELLTASLRLDQRPEALIMARPRNSPAEVAMRNGPLASNPLHSCFLKGGYASILRGIPEGEIEIVTSDARRGRIIGTRTMRPSRRGVIPTR